MAASQTLRWLSAPEVKRRVHGADEVAFLDLREHGQYGAGHPFLAVPLPYSRLEMEAPRRLPCRHTPLILLDAGDRVAEKAARRLADLGYREVFAIEGGAPAWAAAGYTLFQGVNLPSKTFGELVEAELHTPSITAERLSRMKAEGTAVVQLDGRPVEEYRRMTIPGARCCPNAELAHRLSAIAPDPETSVVVSCAGRTRSILGAQSLIAADLPNPIYALENGTQGWQLADMALEYGADRLYPRDLDPSMVAASRGRADRLIETYGLNVIDEAQVAALAEDEKRSLYCLDVRTPEEFAAAHHTLVENAPGGQLVQATDKWIAVRNARIALFDDTGLRAALTALWLRAMGHRPVIVRTPDAPVCWPHGRDAAPVQLYPSLPIIGPDELKSALERDEAQVIDLRPSRAFGRRHIAGARWSIRPRLGALTLVPKLPVVLTAESPAIAALASLDLREMGHEAASFLEPDQTAWEKAGLALEEGDGPSEDEAIDTLFFVHDRHEGNKEAMRAYLAWEIGLVAQLDAQERAVFDLEPLTARR